MKKLIRKNNKEIILNNLSNYISAENSAIETYYENKVEKKLNFVYLLSTFKEECISKLKNKISLLEEEKAKALADLEYKLKNLDISQAEYDQKLLLINSGELNNFHNKVAKIQEAILAKSSKWDKLITKKRTLNKDKIVKINLRKESEISKVAKKYEKLNANLLNKEKQIGEIDEAQLQAKQTEIENSVWMKKYNQLDDKLNQKIIGPLQHQEMKSDLENKMDQEIEKFNDTAETKYSKKYSFKVQKEFMFSFSKRNELKRKTVESVNGVKLIFIIMAFAIFVGIIEPGFFSSTNWKNIFYINADIGCMAIGVTIIILTGGIDLSIGSTLALSVAIGTKLILGGTNVWVAMLVIIIFCAFSGLIAGIFVSLLKFPPFIITLVLMMVWRGGTQYLLENISQAFDSPELTKLIQTEILGLSAIVWIMFLLALIAFIILRCTVYGRHIYAVGGNYRSSQLSGIKSKTVLASVYVFAGICIGVGSVIYAARIQTGSPSAGNAWELDAIACVVLGGTLLTGGKGGVMLTLLGWFSMSVLKNSLNLIGLSSDIQSILKGLIIMLAVMSNTEYKITQKIKNVIVKYYNILKTI